MWLMRQAGRYMAEFRECAPPLTVKVQPGCPSHALRPLKILGGLAVYKPLLTDQVLRQVPLPPPL